MASSTKALICSLTAMLCVWVGMSVNNKMLAVPAFLCLVAGLLYLRKAKEEE